MRSDPQTQTSGDMSIASVRVLRLALGTALSMWFSQIVNWPMSFIAPVFTMLFLGLPIPALYNSPVPWHGDGINILPPFSPEGKGRRETRREPKSAGSPRAGFIRPIIGPDFSTAPLVMIGNDRRAWDLGSQAGLASLTA